MYIRNFLFRFAKKTIFSHFEHEERQILYDAVQTLLFPNENLGEGIEINLSKPIVRFGIYWIFIKKDDNITFLW